MLKLESQQKQHFQAATDQIIFAILSLENIPIKESLGKVPFSLLDFCP